MVLAVDLVNNGFTTASIHFRSSLEASVWWWEQLLEFFAMLGRDASDTSSFRVLEWFENTCTTPRLLLPCSLRFPRAYRQTKRRPNQHVLQRRTGKHDTYVNNWLTNNTWHSTDRRYEINGNFNTMDLSWHGQGATPIISFLDASRTSSGWALCCRGRAN